LRRNQICNYYNCVKMNPSDSLDCLTLHGIKPSANRMAVLEYLMAHPTHPTVDEIYEGLRGSMPTLSKTTVYNALRLMVEHRAIRQLHTADRQLCYDADTSDHAHFYCTQCGRFYDMKLRYHALDGAVIIPDNYFVEQTDLYMQGVCSACQVKGKTLKPAGSNPS